MATPPTDRRIPAARFSPEARLRRSADFARVFAVRQTAGDARLLVFGRPNELGVTRLGLSVSRKFGSAVQRNQYKRLIREAFRLSRGELPVGLDLVVIPRQGTKPTLAGYRQSLPALVRRVARRLNRKEKS